MIRDMALRSQRAVFTVQQLANLISKSKNIAKVYLSRLVKRGLANKIMQGKITFIEDDYIVATQLIEPSYISLNSALLFHNLITQIPKAVECVTPKNNRVYESLGIRYHKISPSMLFGYKKYKKGETYIFVADPEKAIIDGIYLNKFQKEFVKELKEKVDRNKLNEYANRIIGRGRKKILRWLRD